jgi:endoglucanase
MMILLSILLAVSSCGEEKKDPISSAPQQNGPEDVTAHVQNSRIGRGVNLGNALEAPSEGEWGVRLSEDYFNLIAGAGFS